MEIGWNNTLTIINLKLNIIDETTTIFYSQLAFNSISICETENKLPRMLEIQKQDWLFWCVASNNNLLTNSWATCKYTTMPPADDEKET